MHNSSESHQHVPPIDAGELTQTKTLDQVVAHDQDIGDGGQDSSYDGDVIQSHIQPLSNHQPISHNHVTESLNLAPLQSSKVNSDDQPEEAISTPEDGSTLYQSPPNSSKRTAHVRIDSVPPQRYVLDSENPTRFDPGSSLAPTIQEEEIHLESVKQNHLYRDAEYAMDRIVTPIESDKSDFIPAEINFVDVQLQGSSSPQEPSINDSSTLPRSSEQIRQDNVSSSDPPRPTNNRNLPRDRYSGVGVGIPRSNSQSSYRSSFALSAVLESPNLGTQPGPSSRTFETAGSFDEPTGMSRSFTDDAIIRKSVEGRYRGRKSQQSSRNPSLERVEGRPPMHRSKSSLEASPDRTVYRKSDPRYTFSLTDLTTSAGLPSPVHGVYKESYTSESQKNHLPPPLTATTMLVASDDDGDVHVVGEIIISPRTVAYELPQDSTNSLHQPLTSKPFPKHDKETRGLDEECGETVPGTNDATAPKHQLSPKMAAATTITPVENETHGTPADAPPAASEAPSVQATLTSPGLTDKADVNIDSGSSKRRSSKASASESIESRTRMSNLPPKQKAEEIKHRFDFEKMMIQHKELERKRKEEEEERKRRREHEQRESLTRWEKEILPSWTRARKDDELGAVWWKGAPPSIRGRVWALAIGNSMMLARNLLEQSLKRIQGSGANLQSPASPNVARRKIPTSILNQIESDIQGTLPSLKLFQKETGPLYDDLVKVCKAFALVRMEKVDEMIAAGNADRNAVQMQTSAAANRSDHFRHEAELHSANDDDDEDKYIQRGIHIYQNGIATLSAILLINMPVSTAFICLLNLINSKAWLKALYSLSPDPLANQAVGSFDPNKSSNGQSQPNLSPKEKQIRGFERVFETLLADQMPKVYANLLARKVKISQVFLRDWVSQLWGKWLDCDTVMRLWDVILLDETDSLIYRTCLALVQTLESRLYVPDQQELESVLRGTNPAALTIWRRDKELTGELFLPSSSLPTTTTVLTCSSSSSESNLSTSSSSSSSTIISQIVPKDYIYEQYGIKEDTLFSVLEDQKIWWKQSTLERLLVRELDE